MCALDVNLPPAYDTCCLAMRAWFIERMNEIGVTNPQAYIDRQISITTQAEHAAIHDANWNAAWLKWLDENPAFTLEDIQDNIRLMMKDYDIPRASRNFVRPYGKN